MSNTQKLTNVSAGAKTYVLGGGAGAGTLVKGIVSSINTENGTVEATLPEHNNEVTPPLKVLRIYGVSDILSKMKINDTILVVVFNNDFTDGYVLPFSVSTTDDETTSTLGIAVLGKMILGE